MATIFLITEREDLRASLGQYLNSCEGSTAHLRPVPDSSRVPIEDRVDWVPRTFQELATWLEGCSQQTSLPQASMMNSIAIVEDSSLNSIDELDPLSTVRGWSAVLGMLLLAFPEIHWVILSPYQADEPSLQRAHFPRLTQLIQDLKLVLKQRNEGYCPLFDPHGLRDMVRQSLLKRLDTTYVPLRKACAASIDDEESYAYLHAYTCYRFGFRSHVVTSYGTMSRVFATENKKMAVSFEDLYLNFADKRRGLSIISKRDEIFPALKQIKRRIFVTAGHEGETWKANVDYLKARWAAGIKDNQTRALRVKLRRVYRRCHRPSDNPQTQSFVWLLYKPESGVFDVWRRSGLQEEFKQNGGKAEGFKWPPPVEESRSGSSHSAPGRLLLIADRMIARSQKLLRNGQSVPEAVYGAALALDAQEYLGYRTPTIALEAIALKHQLEVMAECMFYGVEYHLDTKRRFAEIENEMESVGAWFRTKTRKLSKVNAQLGIIGDLVKTYRSFNQFDEEQAGLSQLRDLYRRLWLRRNAAWAWLLWPIRWYVDQLLRSIGVFGVVIAGWLLVFGFVFTNIPHTFPPYHVESAKLHGFEDAIVAFFGLQPPHELFLLEQSGPFLVWTSIAVIIMSFLHLGIFVSHLYSLVTRK